MRIIVFGAAGSVGSRVVAEALARDHTVTGVVRREDQLAALPAGAEGRIGDAASANQVATLSEGQDVMISATRPANGSEQDLVVAAKALLDGSARSGARLILVGGAARLKAPDTGGLVLGDPRYVPPAINDIAAACAQQYEACLASYADWAYASPPALLAPGERTGDYRLGSDTLLFNSQGQSTVSIEDFAVALLDEAEVPRHRRAGFTVAGPAFALSESDVIVETTDGAADCYFVHPENGAHAGVIIRPDALGLRPAMRAIGRRLAGVGHAVLVVNPYYRQTRAPIDVDAKGFGEPAGREKVLSLASTITPEMTARDAAAFLHFLDQQAAVDPARKLGAVGYCQGAAMAIVAAASAPDRVGAVACFHGSRLATQETGSPHLQIENTRASALFAIAQSDDAAEPDVKTMLRQSYDRLGLSAEITVLPGTKHGWCVPDTKAYSRAPAEQAWSRMLALFDNALS